MPFKITKLNNGGVINEFEGIVTLEKNAEVDIKIFGEDPAQFKKISYVISDWSKSTKVTHTTEEIRELAKMTRQRLDFNPKLLFAIVVPRDLLYGLARMWHSYLGEEHRTGLFRTREEAEIWIKEKLSEESRKP
ncbi:MAG: hypothetical protein IH995_06175 [Proteobacteria bacterium]|nr:hypothetical protein [Pseudomonadota bacterium]